MLQEIFKDTILTTPGVIELKTFNFDYDRQRREARLDFQALTKEGLIDFTQAVDV